MMMVVFEVFERETHTSIYFKKSANEGGRERNNKIRVFKAEKAPQMLKKLMWFGHEDVPQEEDECA
jgi:hypothetical protein